MYRQFGKDLFFASRPEWGSFFKIVFMDEIIKQENL